MLRRVYLCALIGLALAATGLPAQTATKAASKAGPTASTTSYSVYLRKPGTVDWREYRNYPTSQEANAAARSMYDKGWEVQISSKVTLARVPPRPKAGTLPASETVSPQQAVQLFRLMANQQDIAFRFPADGCYARAHLMIRRMQQRGFKPWKVWTFANGESLYAKTSNHPAGHVEWRYHVAPIVRVRLQNGNQRWFVIDPSLFKAPATITAWRNAQKRPGGKFDPYVTITRLGRAPKDATNKQLPGTGYWPGIDPREGVDLHALKMMRVYKPFEGRTPPKTITVRAQPAERIDLFALPADRRLMAA
jgi:hypothetical protein